jgi:hypothetical protein
MAIMSREGLFPPNIGNARMIVLLAMCTEAASSRLLSTAHCLAAAIAGNQ